MGLKVRQVARVISSSLAAAAQAVTNFGPISTKEYLLGLTLSWSPSAALGATDFLEIRYGWFGRPPATVAEFQAGSQLLTPADVAVNASALIALLPVGSNPDHRAPYFAVMVTNGAAAAALSITGWLWVQPLVQAGKDSQIQ